MTPAELDGALAWAAAEGWNPGRHDAPAFWAADPDGFFVLKVDGRVVSTLAAVRYDDGFGFLGLYITAPHLRRKGHGLELWCAGRAHLDGCVAGLDAVLEQEPTYARDGFATAYATTRYCVAEPSTLPAPPPLTTVAATDVPIDVLVAYERNLFPAPRPDFLAAWLAMPESVSQAVVDGDRLLGWGLRRACIEGHKIGPLFADSADVADALLRALARDADGPLSVDVPEPNSEARALAARHGMTPVFSTVRMYDGAAPALDLDRVFGVTTLELG